jgi:ABC-type nickel/cobalt efflux system permease component RcnA
VRGRGRAHTAPFGVRAFVASPQRPFARRPEVLGIEDQLGSLGSSGTLIVVLGVALLLGVRHATDPDHLTAVTILAADDKGHNARRAGRLGLAWGLGHGSTLIALGIPLVLLKSSLPAAAQHAAEALVGVVIMVLAVRLLLRWRHGHFHAHAHDHAGLRHRHLHAHAREADHRHLHEHAVLAGRSRWQAYGVGLLHGVGGSGGAAVVALAAMPDQAFAVFALLLFAVGTAVSMAVLSSAVGFALVRRPVSARLQSLLPALGAPSLLFGAWYAFGACSGLLGAV